MSDKEDFIKVSDWKNTEEYTNLQKQLDAIQDIKNDVEKVKEVLSKIETTNEQNRVNTRLTKKLVEFLFVAAMFVVPYLFLVNMKTSTYQYTFQCFLWELATVFVCSLWIIEMLKAALGIYNLYNAASCNVDKAKEATRKRVTEFSLELGSWKLRSKWCKDSDVESLSSTTSDSTFEVNESEDVSDTEDTTHSDINVQALDIPPHEGMSDTRETDTPDTSDLSPWDELGTLHDGDTALREE